MIVGVSFEYVFEYDNDIVFFSHFAPYTFSDVQAYLYQKRKCTHNFDRLARIDLLCKSLAGNNIYLLTITEQLGSYFTARDEVRLFREGGALSNSFKKRFSFFSS